MKLSASFVATAVALSSIVHAAPLRAVSADLLERNSSSSQASAAQLPTGSSIETRGALTAPEELFSIEDYLARPGATFEAADMKSVQDVANRFEETESIRRQALSYPKRTLERDSHMSKYHANIATLKNHPLRNEGKVIFDASPAQQQRLIDDQAKEQAELQAAQDRERKYEEQSAKFRAEFQRQQRNSGFRGALKRVWSRISGNGGN